MSELTAKQQAFVNEYVIDFNGAQSAIRAGYSERSAKELAADMLTKPNIQSAIAQAIEDRSKRTKIDADYVLKRLGQIDEMDCADVLNDDGSLKMVRDWPKIWRQMISGIDVTEMSGEGGAIVAVKKIKWPDKVKNLELIGKHVDVSAFREHVGLSGPNGGPIETKATKDMSDEELAAALAQFAPALAKK
jgi:phage terminase small subunit